jgi:hypothetical protein
MKNYSSKRHNFNARDHISSQNVFLTILYFATISSLTKIMLFEIMERKKQSVVLLFNFSPVSPLQSEKPLFSIGPLASIIQLSNQFQNLLFVQIFFDANTKTHVKLSSSIHLLLILLVRF